MINLKYLKKIEEILPVPDSLKHTLKLRTFSFAKWPLLFMTSPKVIELNDHNCRLVMPFRKIIKNHHNSVYFGALAMGADACVGLLAFDMIERSGRKISFIFKSFEADFLKRAEGEVIFICNEGEKVQELIDRSIESRERVHQSIRGLATVKGEEVLRFRLELSVKCQL